MTEAVVSKIEVAREFLDAAIDFFFRIENYFCAIHLSAARERVRMGIIRELVAMTRTDDSNVVHRAVSLRRRVGWSYLEHRAEKWVPVFGKKRCSIKYLERHA